MGFWPSETVGCSEQSLGLGTRKGKTLPGSNISLGFCPEEV